MSIPWGCVCSVDGAHAAYLLQWSTPGPALSYPLDSHDMWIFNPRKQVSTGRQNVRFVVLVGVVTTASSSRGSQMLYLAVKKLTGL